MIWPTDRKFPTRTQFCVHCSSARKWSTWNSKSKFRVRTARAQKCAPRVKAERGDWTRVIQQRAMVCNTTWTVTRAISPKKQKKTWWPLTKMSLLLQVNFKDVVQLAIHIPGDIIERSAYPSIPYINKRVLRPSPQISLVVPGELKVCWSFPLSLTVFD